MVQKNDRKEDDMEKAVAAIEKNYDSFVEAVLKIQESYKNSLDGEEMVKAIETYLGI